MAGTGFGRAVQRVIVIDADGGVHTVYRRKSKKKRQSALLRPLETAARRVAEAARAGADAYLDEHEAANRDARDGWLQDVGPNVFRASRKALGRLTRG
jgi:hypothetical protein